MILLASESPISCFSGRAVVYWLTNRNDCISFPNDRDSDACPAEDKDYFRSVCISDMLAVDEEPDTSAGLGLLAARMKEQWCKEREAGDCVFVSANGFTSDRQCTG
jgi:hypothetical protein